MSHAQQEILILLYSTIKLAWFKNIILGLFTFLVSFNGYLSTINYKSLNLACYLWYQYIQLISRFVYVLYVLAYYLDL